MQASKLNSIEGYAASSSSREAACRINAVSVL
ncbi:hypothetical protein [Coxiella burnetii]|nr:hypothetical protein [Coxiella burnetii]